MSSCQGDAGRPALTLRGQQARRHAAGCWCRACKLQPRCSVPAAGLMDTARRSFQGSPRSLKSPQEITAKSEAVPFLLPRPHLRQSPGMETNWKAPQPGCINNSAKCKCAVTACRAGLRRNESPFSPRMVGGNQITTRWEEKKNKKKRAGVTNETSRSEDGRESRRHQEGQELARSSRGEICCPKNLGQPQHVCGWQRAVFTPRCQNCQGSGSSQRMPQH